MGDDGKLQFDRRTAAAAAGAAIASILVGCGIFLAFGDRALAPWYPTEAGGAAGSYSPIGNCQRIARIRVVKQHFSTTWVAPKTAEYEGRIGASFVDRDSAVKFTIEDIIGPCVRLRFGSAMSYQIFSTDGGPAFVATLEWTLLPGFMPAGFLNPADPQGSVGFEVVSISDRVSAISD